jgi:signal transduction histidine kinase/CheY-like chemotaxis protein
LSELSVNTSLPGAVDAEIPSVLPRSRSFFKLLWNNRPVSDEYSFVQEFRRHSFGFALVTAWASAIVGTINGVYRHEFLKTHEPLPSAMFTILYWTPPLIFAIFKSWSQKNYQWVLIAVYLFYYFRVALEIFTGHRHVDDANVSTISLIVFSVVFLRLPFKHALVLAVGATTAILLVAAREFGYQSFRLEITSCLTLALSLYTSWRMEDRDRSIFEKRLDAQKQFIKAERSAVLEQQHRILAENAAAKAEEQGMLANEAARNAQVSAEQTKLLHEELRVLYTQRELLIRGLHHDANQSLNVLGSMVHVLKEKISSDSSLEAIRPYVIALDTSTSDLGHLMAGMYDLVKMGQYVPHYEPVPLNELLNRIKLKFGSIAASKRLRFDVKCRADEIFLWTDRTAIERILDNLVANAIKYTIKGGVLVGTVLLERELRIDVCDTGVGIPRERKDDIFKEFVRLGQPGVGDVQGMGLGLAIVHLLRDKLQGSGLYLDHNSRVDRGSRFSISVPFVDPPSDQSLNEMPSSSATILDKKKVYVVLVEDNSAVLEGLRDVLRSAGYDVDEMVRLVTSVDGVKSIFDGMPNRAPNVVVCDFRLGKDGDTANDVIALIDSRFEWTRVPVPVIVYSADIQPNISSERGNLRVIIKSSNPSVLLREMESLIVENMSQLSELTDED